MSPQSSIAHYRITSKLGEGGMGAVYRATDTKLNRDVAIKVLPDSFAADPDRLARFAREAQVLASLNHPNISQIYGVEDRALVMELVDGPTLADRIAQGPIPLDEAMHLARQIAEALEYAHEHGIVHRDLKPANIKIAGEGRVKVLDFGLAKAMAADTVSADPIHSPTLTMGATVAGVILGTAAYMSPEQAHGKPADRRADIWSFGVVLFEMLSGRTAFSGQSVSETLASVLKSEPEWRTLPAGMPPVIVTLLRRCLTKEPRSRLQAIGDARIAIEEYLANPEAAESGTTAPATRQSRLSWAIAAALALALLTGGAMLLRERSATAPSIRSSILPPDEGEFYLSGGNCGTPVLSPDGARIAFTADRRGDRSLWVRDLHSGDAHILPGTASAQYPFWSPDSKWLGYFTNQGKLVRIEVAGGLPVVIADASNGKGGSWNRDGVIILAPNSNLPIYKVPASGGKPVPVTQLDTAQGEDSHREPEFLPDGRHFLFVARGSSVSGAAGHGAAIRIGSLDGQPSRMLMPAESQALFASGQLLFAESRKLIARAFDPDKLAFTGDPVTVASDIFTIPGIFRSVFSVSANGTLIYLTGHPPDLHLSWWDRAGRLLQPIASPGTMVLTVAMAPDLKRAATVSQSGRTTEAISIVDLARGVATPFTTDSSSTINPVWSADGSAIVFISNRRGSGDLYWKAAAGGSADQLLFASDADKNVVAWSADGRMLAYLVSPPHPDAGYWLLPLQPGNPPKAGTPVLLSRGFATDMTAGFSPDGKWLAYSTLDASVEQVYITDTGGRGRRFLVSPSGGMSPRWQPSGKEIVYLAADGKMMSVTVAERGESLDIGTPQPLFDTHVSTMDFAYDVTPDGKRFLVQTPESSSNRLALTLVTNWTAGLKK